MEYEYAPIDVNIEKETQILCEHISYGSRRLKSSKFCFNGNGKYSYLPKIFSKILRLSKMQH
jgi:hypothetical protein